MGTTDEMEDNIKRMNLKEFMGAGYLQEVNRQFFHPLGLALEVLIDEDGDVTLNSIWDYRNDPEGIHYNIKRRDKKSKDVMKQKQSFIKREREERGIDRKNLLGFIVEPIK